MQGTLISPEVLDALEVHTADTQYTVTSCSGSHQEAGTIARNLTIQSLDKGYSLSHPTEIECSDIPDDVMEIPTPYPSPTGHQTSIRHRCTHWLACWQGSNESPSRAGPDRWTQEYAISTTSSLWLSYHRKGLSH